MGEESARESAPTRLREERELLTAKIDSDYTAVDDFHERDSGEITDFRKTISNQETLCSVAMR
jgi:hypothetical protein